MQCEYSISKPYSQTTLTFWAFSSREQAGGQKALDLIEFKKNPAVIAICETWAGDYDASGPLGLGFAVDDRQQGYAQAVADFQETLKA